MTEHIEVPVRSDIPLSKYLARLPKALFLKARSHCDRKGVSLNTLITLALRDYLDAGDIDVPSQPKLSQVFKDELAAMETRLLAAIKPSVVVSMEGVQDVDLTREELSQMADIARGNGGLYEGLAEQMHDVQEVVHEHKAWASSIGTRRRPTRDAVDFVPPSNLDWDSPSPHNRLFPDNPPVMGAAPEPLRGQVWVVTGDFDSMTTSRVREILQQAGAIVATTVNKKTSAVLAGIAGEGEKLDAAEGRLIPIWTELQFLHMARFIGADVRIPE